MPRWRQSVEKVRYQWLRDGTAIDGATGRRYVAGHRDVGHRLTVRATGSRKASATAWPRRRARSRSATGCRCGAPSTTTSRPAAGSSAAWPTSAGSPTPPQRPAGLAGRRDRLQGGRLRRLDDAGAGRGVPGAGVLVGVQQQLELPGRALRGHQPEAVAARLAGLEPATAGRCATTGTWSSTTRPATGSATGTGPARPAGALAPVMQQQSISLGGCRFNPFPTKREWFTPRF